ncbi:MAG: hypothetical protein GXO74_02480 [Calditrichaeota bacterium]|nr:hypothetical protein [Calditrichota bacterium]
MKIKTILLLIALTISQLFGAVGDWITFTNQSDIRDMAVDSEAIWCVTNGGVFRFDLADSAFQQFYNTNGLSALDAQAITIDGKGAVWVGFSDGWLNCYHPETGAWVQFDDYLGHQINDLTVLGDSLLVALDIGISLYDIQRQEVKETYKNLGSQIPVETPVVSLLLNGKEIWAATEYGIAQSSFDLANLMAPESWTNYTMNHGLPSNMVHSIEATNNAIFAATDAGVAKKEQNNWIEMNTGLPSENVLDLASFSDTLFALAEGYVYQWDSSAQSWHLASPYIYKPVKLVFSGDGTLWVGRQKTTASGGLGRFNKQTNQWTEFYPPGPPGNDISCLKIDQNGILWCGSLTDGVFKYDDKNSNVRQRWQQFTTNDGLAKNVIEAIAVDYLNRKWVATRGGGVSIIDDKDSLTSITTFSTNVFSGISSDPNYILITDLKQDRYNNMWILNLEPANNNVVAVYSALQQWQYFSRQEGFLSGDVRALDFDQYGRVWVASDGGVNVIDYNNTLTDKSDDDLSGTLTTVDGLEANKVKDIAIDQDNIAWIATEDGLNYWAQGNVYYQGGLISNNINVVEVDIRNNKWFGTTGGVSVLAPDGITFTHYTTENSPLVSDNITAFAFDEETGRVYIGSTEGLSCLVTPFSKPRENLNDIKAGPNPFFPPKDAVFSIANLTDDVDIRIMTENGAVVRTISKDEILGAQALWDGKNDQGKYVASGVYLFVIFNKESGINRIGKVAVIR